ncbi:hypothetical protein AB0I98_31560 [Streptomyces sp. NPDC050211]|uniref:hypothetical protein n=1 Tax=Streptomyces sp. NPDC050211 TaxID=3154932 RepID=UPI00342E953B
MKFKRTLRGAGVSAAAVATTFAMATGAQAADPDHTLWTNDDRPGGKIEFTRNGDKLEVCDDQPDGLRAVAYVINPDGTQRYGIAASGSGNCTDRDDSDGSRYNLNENKRYTFRVCLDENEDGSGDDRFCQSRKWRAGAG